MKTKTKLEEVLEKYFPQGKYTNKYFHSSDAHKTIEGDTYITYKWYDSERIELILGGDNGEYTVTITSDSEKVETLIKSIIR